MSPTEEHLRDSAHWSENPMKAAGLVCSWIILTELTSVAPVEHLAVTDPDVKCVKGSFFKNKWLKENTKYKNIFLFVAFVDIWPSGYMFSSVTVCVPLWLHYPWLYVPVTCRDIKSDPILLVFVVNTTCHANKDLAGRSCLDHKKAIMGGSLPKSWPAGDGLPIPPSNLWS